jgi:hypothetical protein
MTDRPTAVATAASLLGDSAAAALVIPRMFRSATLRSPAFAERSGHRSRQVSGRTPDSTETHRPLLSHTA